MEKTQFAGLTKLEPGESLIEDDGSFIGRDRDLIDFFLERGAKTHRHTGASGLPDPDVAPSASVTPSGGTIPGELDLVIGYTLQDDSRGETTLSPTVTVTTPDRLPTPDTAPTVEVVYTDGNLTVDTYYYAVTHVDGDGGETPLGPAAIAQRQPGYANAKVELSDLDAGLADVGAAGWRLYRARSGGQFAYLASGTGGTFTDDGSVSPVCDAQPPNDDFNTTNQVNKLTIDLPGSGAVGDASFINVYLSETGDFGGSTFLAQYPAASAGASVEFEELILFPGSPPDVSTSVGDPPKIDAVTEIDWGDDGPPSGANVEVTDGVTTVDPANRLVFDGATVTDNGDGEALIEIEGGTGGGGGGVAISGPGVNGSVYDPIEDSDAAFKARYVGSVLTYVKAENDRIEWINPEEAGNMVLLVHPKDVDDGYTFSFVFHTSEEWVDAPSPSIFIKGGSGGKALVARYNNSSGDLELCRYSGGMFTVLDSDELASAMQPDTTYFLEAGYDSDTGVFVALREGDNELAPALAQIIGYTLTGEDSDSFGPSVKGPVGFAHGLLEGGLSTPNDIAWFDDLRWTGLPWIEVDPATHIVFDGDVTLSEGASGEVTVAIEAIGGGSGASGAADWSILDAKGDLIVATADDTPSRLAVGNDGQVLTAASGESGGMKWASPKPSRETVTVITSSLADDATDNVSIPLGKSFRLLAIETSVAARVRLYATPGDRTADAARPIGTDPTGDHGVILDHATTPGDTEWRFSPLVDGSSMEDPPEANIAAAITNISGSTASIAVTLTFLELEA